MAAQVGLALQGKFEHSLDFFNDFPFYIWSSQTESSANPGTGDKGSFEHIQKESYIWTQQEENSSLSSPEMQSPVQGRKQCCLWTHETKVSNTNCTDSSESSRRPGRRPKITIPPNVKRYRQLRRNARERERQGRLNSAFDVLRGVIPDYLSGKGPERKLTQIETLRLATHYIMALGEMLEDDPTQQHEDFCDCAALFRETADSFGLQR